MVIHNNTPSWLLFVYAGLVLGLIVFIWHIAIYMKNKYQRIQSEVHRRGFKNVIVTRRNTMKLSISLIGLSGLVWAVDTYGGQSTPNLHNTTSDLMNYIESVNNDTAKREFHFNKAGYDKARWTNNGKLQIVFQDEPPMEEWYLISPKPDRNVIASGKPPQFGGDKIISLSHPIEPGEYMFTGAKIEADDDAIFGMEAERTPDVYFSVSENILVTKLSQAENETRAVIDIKNTGSMPVVVQGMKFSKNVPGTGSRRYFNFMEDDRILIPTESLTLTVDAHPFYIPDTDGEAQVPDEFQFSIWANDSAHRFKYIDGKVKRMQETATE